MDSLINRNNTFHFAAEFVSPHNLEVLIKRYVIELCLHSNAFSALYCVLADCVAGR